MFMGQSKFVRSMATVIGIFEEQYKKNKPLTVIDHNIEKVTHVKIQLAYYSAWKINKCRHYSISNKKVILY